MRLFGLDIGTNSVGSAWVDTDARTITMGVTVFPAGVEQSEGKRGAPKNQARRSKRSLRRSIHRRALRKRRLRELLVQVGLLPEDGGQLQEVLAWDPWNLRRKGLSEELTPHEFGRVLVHLNQHRGALGIRSETDKEGEVRTAISRLQLQMMQRYDPQTAERLQVGKRLDELNNKGQGGKRKKKDAKGEDEWRSEFGAWIEKNPATYGRMMADIREDDEHHVHLLNAKGEPKRRRNGQQKYYQAKPIRNRQDSFLFHADRAIIRDEFKKLWEKQLSFGGKLARLLMDYEQLRKWFDDPQCELYAEEAKRSWRHGGALFGQRKTYWRDPARCELEPTDRCVPEADMYAQEFRVLDYVNNLRVVERELSRPLRPDGERATVLDLLRKPRPSNGKGKRKAKDDVTVADLTKALGLAKPNIPRDYYRLTLSREDEQDEEAKPVIDWFNRSIACAVFGEEEWLRMDDRKKDSVNRAILKFDPDDESDERRMREGAAGAWGWNLSPGQAEQFIVGWKSRPALEKRRKLSRTAIRNLLAVMRNPHPDGCGQYPNQIQAKKILAEDFANALTVEQRARYIPKVTEEFKHALINRYGKDEATKAIRQRGLNKKARHYLKKHVGNLLPPAPEVSNPVVRKAIHEVRRHILAHLQAQQTEDGRIVPPERVVIELAREGRQSAKVRDAIHARNKARRKIREGIVKQHRLERLTRNQQERAIERVLLCRQQNYVCPYTSLSADDRRKQAKPEDGTCPYSGKTITEEQAVRGDDVEIDHVVPYSKCGDDSINNKVLCYREANQRKGNWTPKDWMGEDSAEFKAMEQRMRHLNIVGKKTGGPSKEDYFTKKDYKRKWDNLHRDPEPDEFRNSQLSDAAYAAGQVGDYLRSALFNGESEGEQRVFFTNGKLTARLRDDWMLYQEIREKISKDDPQAKEKDERNWQRRLKDRGDHRHHPIDAVVIALTPYYVNEIAQEENYRETYHQRTGNRPRRKRMDVPSPWPSLADFRRSVLSKVFASFDDWGQEAEGRKGVGTDLIVSHRPEKRRLVGGLHNDMAHGTTEEPGEYVRRKRIKDLLPKKPTDSAGWVKDIRSRKDPTIRKMIEQRLEKEGIEVVEKKGETGRPAIKFMDKATGKPPTIEKIRKALSNLRMRSGVPIHAIRIRTAIGNPVHPVGNDGVERFYESDNNHHVEILRDPKTGKWSADPPVRMYDAAVRNIDRLRALKKAGVPTARQMRKLKEDKDNPERYRAMRERYRPIIAEINRTYPIVNRNDRDGKEFVMSLAIGEMVHMRHKRTRELGYFVVFKLDKGKIWFTRDRDARPAKGKGTEKRDGFSLSASQLKDYGIDKSKPPYKVRVSPLGDFKELTRD
jgi:CRISPR-associated endonuclease Csn1